VGDSVKINKDLLKKVKSLISKSPHNIKYASAKQFIDIAVLELLEKEEKKEVKNE
jgi:hypothetical protein